MAEHNELGEAGEKQAEIYLQKTGYKIRHTHWRSGPLELDIVAEKDEVLIVVEVKTRSTDTFEAPEEAVTNKKIRHLVRAAHEYIYAFDWQGETRFDIISVIPYGQQYKIDHIEDAFLAPVN